MFLNGILINTAINEYMYDKRELIASVILAYIKGEIKESDKDLQYHELAEICKIALEGLNKSFE